MVDTPRLGGIAKLKIAAGSRRQRLRRRKDNDKNLNQPPPGRDVCSKPVKRKLALVGRAQVQRYVWVMVALMKNMPGFYHECGGGVMVGVCMDAV
jgi:hypothetical protein